MAGPIAAALLLLLVVVLQIGSGFFATEFARHPDEPAHFVTGVLVYDYLRSGFDQSPISFAEQFQAQYPKVAFGHWPPMFYAIQSLWYMVFGPNPRSLILLLGVVTALIASLLFWRTNQRHGPVIGMVTTGVFLGTTMVQQATLIVGSDSLVTLFCFLAVLAFLELMRFGRGRSLAAFAAFASLGLLTKGTALPLAAFALLAPVFARRTAVFRSRAMWLTAIVISVIVGPLYLASLQLGEHGALGDLISYLAYPSTRLFVLGQFANITSPVVLAVAVLGLRPLLDRTATAADLADRRDDAAAALAWVLAVIGFHVLTPITGETRYLLPTLVAVLLLFADGLHTLGDALVARWRRAPAALVPVAIGVLSLATQLIPLPVLITGYGAVARAIPTKDTAPVRVLISSNAQGEGAFVAARLVHDANRTSSVLRAYKVLADDDWFGKAYRVKVETVSAVREVLLRDDVAFVVVDDFGQPPGRAQPHHQLLQRTLAAYPTEFTLMGLFDIRVGSRTVPDAVLLYRRERGSADRLVNQ